jgi:serine O-acetyltransferase
MRVFLADLARYAHGSPTTHRAATLRWRPALRAVLVERATWAVAEFRLRQWVDTLPWLVRWPGKVITYGTRVTIETLTGVCLPTAARIGPGFVVSHTGPVVMHADTVAGEDFTLHPQTTIGTHDGGVPRFGDRVFVGPGARVLGRITVADDALIGANAVVMVDVPANHVAVGVPATTSPNTRPPWLSRTVHGAPDD